MITMSFPSNEVPLGYPLAENIYSFQCYPLFTKGSIVDETIRFLLRQHGVELVTITIGESAA